MSKQQTCAPLIEKKKEFKTKLKPKLKKTENIEHIATFTDSSFIHLRTKEKGVFVYIRKDSENIDQLLKQGTNKKDYEFGEITPEKLREKFLKATKELLPIYPIESFTLWKGKVYLDVYELNEKIRVYNITEALHTEHPF